MQFERFRAAQYSRELSDKVWRGCVKITEQGYWAGGSPPYAMRRLLLDEKREPLQPLEPGQRKGIQNQRVTLIEGEPEQVEVIQRIFHEFVSTLNPRGNMPPSVTIALLGMLHLKRKETKHGSAPTAGCRG